jgi:cyanophycinase
MTRSMKVPVGATILLFAVLACEPVTTPDQAPGEDTQEEVGTPGRQVIVGGALQTDNTEVYEAILAGRSGDGPLCVIPTASADPEGSMNSYVSAFDALAGEGTAQGIPISVENGEMANDPELAQQMRLCSGFFFTGGSQSRIMNVFEPGGTPTLISQALWERYEAGAVVSGSSAGAAIMTDPMIAGGGSVGALESGVSSGEDGEGVRLTPGFGFLDVGLVDQHFLARGRWGRLAVAVLASPEDPLGFGIDENTALVVEGDLARVVGASGVVFMDGRSAASEEGGNGGYGIRLFLLGKGDSVNLVSGEVTPDPTKTELPGEGLFDAAVGAEPFARWVLLHILHELATTTDERLTLRQGEHFMELRKGPGFRASSWDGMGVEGTPSGLSMGPFVLSLWRE